jgi:hypothetical protein
MLFLPECMAAAAGRPGPNVCNCEIRLRFEKTALPARSLTEPENCHIERYRDDHEIGSALS